jgi:dTMP kinase
MVIKGGLFIVFEGIDGAGKSTLINKIEAKFQEINAKTHTTAEPTKNYIGKHIREILNGKREGDEKTIASLFLADRIDHLTHSEYGILFKLSNEEVVLCDRYYLSSYAYHVPYVTLDWVINANSICSSLRRADLTFFIDISVGESLRRLALARESLDKFENEQRMTEVRGNYFSAIEKVKAEENIIIIDGEKSQNEVVDMVWESIQLWFTSNPHRDL